MKNLILYDWLSFTVRDMAAEDVMDLLHLKSFDCEIKSGFYGYRYRYFNGNGISIHYDGTEDQGVLLEMSGSGCRYFESNSSIDWNTLFFLLDNLPVSRQLHYTRLDIAFDDHEGLLDLGQIVEDTFARKWVSPFRWSEVQKAAGDNKGCSVYFGSPQSESRIRIYDKAAERNAENEGHWIRIELQLRRDRAAAFLARRSLGLSDLFAGVMLNYLRFVQPSEDSNKSRWPMADYWERFLGAAVKVKIFSAPGVEYNRNRLENFIYGNMANAIYTALVLDTDNFLTRLEEMQLRSGGLPEKYLHILKENLFVDIQRYEKLHSELWDAIHQVPGQMKF